MHIVLATDGSANGNAGIDLLSAAGAGRGDRVTVVVVRPSRLLLGDGLTAPPGTASDQDVATAIADLQVARLGDAGFGVDALVLSGDPAAEIVRTAESLQADLIMVGIRGHNRLQRLLIGSTSSAIARLTRLPVLLTREPVSLARTLVVCDNTASSIRTAEVASRLPAGLLREVILLHLNPEGAVGASIRSALDNAAVELETAGMAVDRQEEIGNEVEVALRLVKDRAITLVVVAASEERSNGEPLLGTTAWGLVEQATASILIVH